MKSKTFKILFFVVCVVLAACMVACSPRSSEGGGDNVIDDGKKTTTDTSTTVLDDKDAAWEYIKNSMDYLDATVYSDPSWLCINTSIAFDFHAYEKSGGVYTDVAKKLAEYNLTVMMNISLKDNSQSTALIELNNTYRGATYLGIYYYGSTTYLNFGGKKYYTEELNLTRIGEAIVEALKLGTSDETDIVDIIGNFLCGTVDAGNYASIIKGMGWNLLFSSFTLSPSADTVTYTALDDNGRETTYTVPKYRYVNEYLKIDWIMSMIETGHISFLTFVDLDINWETFGLPDLDHILEDTLGFNLRTIIEKDWPSMAFSLHAITEMENVTLADGSTGHDYVFNGAGISILTDTGEYDVTLDITPLIFKLSDTNEVGISLAGYNLGSSGKGTTYTEGSLTNIGANFQLAVDADKDETLTVGKILGNVVDLGAIGNIPINIAGDTHYVFDVKLAAALDLFDNAGNYAQVAFDYNGKEVFAVYLAPDISNTVIGGKSYKLDTLYFDFSNLTSGGEAFLPNTKIGKINLTASLASLIGEDIMTYLDPYRGKTSASRNASSTLVTEGTGMDVKSLITLLIAEDENGNYKYLTLPKKSEGTTVFSLHFDNYAINTLASMFTGGMTKVVTDAGDEYYENGIGLTGVTFSIDFAAPLSSIELCADVTDTTSIAVRIGSKNSDGTYNTGLTYFVMPDFDFSAIGLDKSLNVENADTATALRSKYKDLSETLSYTATVTGEISLGSTAGTSINLDSVMAYLVKSLFANLGLTDTFLASIGIESSGQLNIGYEIQIGTSLVNMSSTSAVIDLYFLDGGGGGGGAGRADLSEYAVYRALLLRCGRHGLHKHAGQRVVQYDDSA